MPDYKTLTNVPECPICDNPDRRTVYVDPRYNEKQSRTIVQCTSCGMCYVSPMIMQNYENLKLEDYQWDHTNIPGFVYMIDVFEQVFLQKLSPRLLTKRPREILEVGCGPGFALDIMRARNWNTTGLEVWKDLSDWSKKHLRLDIRSESLSSSGLPKNHYDAVFMSEVIEHLADPLETLKLSFQHLVPGGVVFLSCPNFESVEFKTQGWAWSAIDPYGHVQYFTPTTLSMALQKAGFVDIAVRLDGGLPHRDEQIMIAARKPV